MNGALARAHGATIADGESSRNGSRGGGTSGIGDVADAEGRGSSSRNAGAFDAGSGSGSGFGSGLGTRLGLRFGATTGRPGRGHGRLLGAHGEAAAARYLERAGYRIIERNWVCRDPDLRGELDLIACLRRTLVVFEVKTRSTGRLAHPAEAVTRAKAIRLRRLGVRWLSGRRNRLGGQRLVRRMTELRIDVIAIRTEPEPPYTVLTLDHLVGVA